MFALIQHDRVWEIFPRDPKFGDAVEVIEVPDTVGVGWRRTPGGFEAPEAVAPATPPIPSVRPAQAKIQLLRAGLLDQVRVLIDEAGPEARIWFDTALSWERRNPYVVALGAELGLNDAAIDTLFRDAAQIQA